MHIANPSSTSGAPPRPAVAWPAKNHSPTAVSNACAPAPVHTRQIVDRDGRPTGAAPTRAYSCATTGAGTSPTQPAIAV
jgi:hypothetical protein